MYTYCFLTFRNILDHEGIVQKNSSKGAAISINTVQYCRKQGEIKFEETVNIHVQLCLIQRKNWSFFIPLMHVHVRNRLLQYYTDDEVFKFDHIVPYDVQLYLSTAIAVTITALVFYGLIQKTLNFDQILPSAQLCTCTCMVVGARTIFVLSLAV